MTVKRDDQEQDIPVYNVNQDDIETPSNQGTTNNDNGPVMAEAVPVQSQPEVPVTTPTPNTVDVIAPTNMAGGYQFNVDAGGRLLRVAVPAGGVQAGQRFGAIILQQGGAGTGSPQDDPHMIPRGHWRDGLCDCCKFGCCHAQCCLAFWCSSCALGQIMTRLKLNLCGEPIPGGNKPGMTTFRILFIITCVYILFNWITGAIIQTQNEDGEEYTTSDEESELSAIVSGIQDIVQFAFFIFMLFLTIRTRGYIRRKYEIPAECCGGCEDCCCSFWCYPCTICQMARHTANYNNYNANCCSDTGLDANAPAIV